MLRIARGLSIHIDHPRRPEPSRAYAWAKLDGKREDTVHIDMTEKDLIELAKAALDVAIILRRANVEPLRVRDRE